MAMNVDQYRDELMQAINEKGKDLILCAVWAVRSNGAECGGMKCNTCRNKSVAWLFQEADPALLKNGDGLNPRRSYHGA